MHSIQAPYLSCFSLSLVFIPCFFKPILIVCVSACVRQRGCNNCPLAVYFIDFGSHRTLRWRVSTPAPYSGGPWFKSWPRDRLLWLGDLVVSQSGILPESASNQDIYRVACMIAKALFTNHPIFGRCCMLGATEIVVKYLRQNCRILVERATGGEVTRQRLETLRNPRLFLQ